jgi:site-specific DNA recombinase
VDDVRGDVPASRPASGRQQALRRPQHQGPFPAPGPGRLLGLRVRLLPTSTRTTSKKIYYYRCLSSDDYRYEGGRVCGNQSVRAGYLDEVVWDHITALLADPALIRGEISKRLEAARTSAPVTSQRKRLQTALAKATASITAMIEAFSEQLVTIDELRARMPHLRARETSLRGQLDALDAQAADRDACLKLPGDLEGFLAQLHGNAATATVEDRQRVLRLLVKDILIGPEKITIRHRIPTRPDGSGARQRDPGPDTEGDHQPDYLLHRGGVHPQPGRDRDPGQLTAATATTSARHRIRPSDSRRLFRSKKLTPYGGCPTGRNDTEVPG